jgi:uncharacterized DUF497 family protein
MRLEFDPEKDEANRRKHGVSLAFGARVFEDADYLLISTFREQDGEDRVHAGLQKHADRALPRRRSMPAPVGSH